MNKHKYLINKGGKFNDNNIKKLLPLDYYGEAKDIAAMVDFFPGKKENLLQGQI